MSTEIPVITIDGPSGSGKGTISQLVARKLGWHYLDSGALYRALALAAMNRGIALDDSKALRRLAGQLDVVFDISGTQQEVIVLDGREVTQDLRTESCGNAASKVASQGYVRTALLDWQRQKRQQPGLVADGRDMGTVVFPQASLKIYLTASIEERARRRYKQLMEKGISANLEQLSKVIAERDVRDAKRSVAPLKAAHDAHVIDTTTRSIEEVAVQVMQLIQGKASAISM